MKDYKILHDHPDHFLVSNGKAHFKIAKAGINLPTADKIRALSDGGTVQTRNEEIETKPEEEKYELPPAPEADLDSYKPTQRPEPSEEEPREIEMEIRNQSKDENAQKMADGGGVEKVSDDLDMYKHGMDVTNPEDTKKYENIKQLSKETGLPKFDDGGTVDAAQSVQDAF